MNRNPSSQKRIQSIVSQFRNYDKAIYDWLSEAPTLDDGSPVPVVFATPDRAFSAMNLLLKTRGYTTTDLTPKSIPLPFISVTSNSIQFDPSRFHGPVTMEIGKSDDNRSVYTTKFPIPYDIGYRVEFWAKNEDTLNIFKLWMATGYSVGFENFIDVDLSNIWPFWKRRIVAVRNDGMRFSGNYEPEEGHRVLRAVADMSVNAWIISDIKETKSVHKIMSGIFIAKSYADVASVTSEEVDVKPELYELIDSLETR